MNVGYLIPRLFRHFLPPTATRFLLQRGWIIRPGLETRHPELAARRYAEALQHEGRELAGKRALVLGYGGNFAVGCALLNAGAQHVVLCDPYAPPDDRRNARLLPQHRAYLINSRGHILPRPEHVTLLQADVRSLEGDLAERRVDLVFSTSVYEHLDDVEGITRALAALTTPSGMHVHFIDLRDHFFRYPFEMLCYSEKTWARWLNPGSHHNRYRLGDYQHAFSRHFQQVKITVLERDPEGFARVRERIRPEFQTGDPEVDSVTLIRVVATGPAG